MERKKIIAIKAFIQQYFLWIVLSLVFALHIFLRFYQMETLNLFGWDQVDNAWAAVDIIVHHKLPLLGMVAKQNSGIFIGPAYYYLISIFYFFSNLDPIASGLFAGVTSIFSFIVLFYITKKLFSFQVALIAIFLNTVAEKSILFDRVQWPVELIPAISLIIFYCLYQVITGKPKYLMPFTIAFGFSFHLHFTSIFYPIIFLLVLPFFPRKKETIQYIFLSIPILLLWLSPNILAELQAKNSNTGNALKYGNSYYHGFHMIRVLQLAKDAFIQFDPFLTFPIIKFLKYILLPLFSVIHYLKNHTKNSLLLSYLFWLWFIVPWFVFATYGGEISDYYFSINRYFVLLVLAYCIYAIFSLKVFFIQPVVVVCLVLYMVYNITSFFTANVNSLQKHRLKVKQAIEHGKVIPFAQGDPDSYLFYISTRKNTK